MPLDVRISWFHGSALVLRLMVVVPVTLGWVFIALVADVTDESSWEFITALALASVVAVPAAGSAVLLLVNATRVRTEGEVVRVSHGPLPWVAPPPIARRRVAAVVVVPTATHQAVHLDEAKASRLEAKARANRGWSVELVLEGGGMEELVGGVRDRAEAETLAVGLRRWISEPGDPEQWVTGGRG